MVKLIISGLASLFLSGCNMTQEMVKKPPRTVKIATFNVSMDATNYVGRSAEKTTSEVLITALKNNNQQIRNIAQIIQTIRPDIILLNEFDYINDPRQGVEYFINNYLAVAQGNAAAIDYPYYYYAEVNTGKASPYDLTGDGKATGTQGDAWGFGFFEGHFGMALLSRYPIEVKNVRTFQHFKWQDMPDALRPVHPGSGEFFYNDEIWQQFPLSSKSHWDIPVNIDGETIHILASHPTPPVFDGPEDRNGTKNHDEVRFWLDYISGVRSRYIYDDNGNTGGINANARFIIVGDQNASATEGGSRKEAISALLTHANVNDDLIPQSAGGRAHTSNNPHAKHHTAHWGMRADYVLPSRTGFRVLSNGVFWPEKSSSDYHLIKDRNASSDHRLVWSELALIN